MATQGAEIRKNDGSERVAARLIETAMEDAAVKPGFSAFTHPPAPADGTRKRAERGASVFTDALRSGEAGIACANRRYPESASADGAAVVSATHRSSQMSSIARSGSVTPHMTPPEEIVTKGFDTCLNLN